MYKINKNNIARLLAVKSAFEKSSQTMISMENFIMLLLDIYEKDYSKIANRQAKKIAKTLIEFYAKPQEEKNDVQKMSRKTDRNHG